MNPFPGLRPFEDDHIKYYVGRETGVEEVIARVFSSGITVLFAKSGIGKSSFLNSRVMPELERRAYKVFHENEWGEEAPDEIVDRCSRVTEASARPVEESRGGLVLIMDQFEDIFKLPFDRKKLWQKLGQRVKRRGGTLHVLLSIREDWLG